MINIFKEAPEQREKRKSLVNKIFVINKLAINNIGIFFLWKTFFVLTPLINAVQYFIVNVRVNDGQKIIPCQPASAYTPYG